jgi:hypothetical protein
MSAEKISLMKTLCAMRWIALLNDNKTFAKVLEANMNYLGE